MIMGCHNNVWQWLTTSPTFVPQGLFEPDGGFAAGLGAAGYLLADESEQLADYMYTAAAEEGLLRLGDLHKEALIRYMANPLNPSRLQPPNNYNVVERIQCLSLVGDPALVIRHDVTSFGTDAQWLVAHGQTNANADLEDPDGDGWMTYEEFEGLSNPTNNVLQVVSAGMDTNSGAPMIAFETTATNSYQIEYKPDLGASNDWNSISWSVDGTVWNPAETNIIPSGPIMSVLAPVSTIQTQGFFRVRTAE